VMLVDRICACGIASFFSRPFVTTKTFTRTRRRVHVETAQTRDAQNTCRAAAHGRCIDGLVVNVCL
jgi:hypothetical protein